MTFLIVIIALALVFDYINGFAGAAIAHGGFGAINAEPVIKTASFILLAPLVGMLAGFLISIWFIYSFRKGPGPRIVSLLVIALVAWFLFSNLETDPRNL